MDSTSELVPHFDALIQKTTDKTTQVAHHRIPFPQEISMDLEMRLRYPEQWQEFTQTARFYEQLAGKKDWAVPELADTQVQANLHLLKTLDNVNIATDVSPKDRYLTALSVLDYCHNPHRMAKRTKVSENEIKFISQEAKQRVSDLCAELSEDGYGAGKPNPADAGGLIRPYAIFLNDADIAVINQGASAAGLADYASASAFVNANSQTRLDTAVHEDMHLVRMVYQDQLHKRFLHDARLNNNLEEGCTVLATDMAMSRADFHTPHAWGNYAEAARVIKDGLIPTLLDKAREKWISTDLPHPNPTPEQLAKILTGRFLLGDYELLDRLCSTDYYGRDPYKTTLRNAVGEHPSWDHVQEVLESVHIFGLDLGFINAFGQIPSSPDDRFREVDVRGMTYLPLPLQYADGVVLLPEYRYQVKSDKDDSGWVKVSGYEIPVAAIPGRLRINCIDVQSDWKKE